MGNILLGHQTPLGKLYAGRQFMDAIIADAANEKAPPKRGFSGLMPFEKLT
jgi:hypothetical protein